MDTTPQVQDFTHSFDWITQTVEDTTSRMKNVVDSVVGESVRKPDEPTMAGSQLAAIIANARANAASVSGGGGSVPGGMTSVGNGQSMAGPAAHAFLAAQRELASMGISLSAISGYRSYAEQAQLYNEFLAGTRSGPVAKPGNSEHNQGLAVDIGYSGNLATIRQVMAKYGFRQFDPNGDPNHFAYQVSA